MSGKMNATATAIFLNLVLRLLFSFRVPASSFHGPSARTVHLRGYLPQILPLTFLYRKNDRGGYPQEFQNGNQLAS
jgi:hypothetical protein